MRIVSKTEAEAGTESPLKRVRVDDIDIAYKEWGSGEPLVLVAALGTTVEMWDARFVRRLAAKYRVIAFDNRGMGKSTTGTAVWSIDRFAADAAGFIGALGLQKASVLGWSIGGDIALSLAVNFPERVDKLIIYAGDCGGLHKVAPPRYRDVLKEVIRGTRAPLKWIFAYLFPLGWMQENPGCWRTVPFLGMRFRPLNLARQNKAYETWEGVYERLPEIANRALVVTGTEDVSTPPENAFILADEIPGSSLVLAPEAGHGLMYQYPIEFADTVADFISLPYQTPEFVLPRSRARAAGAGRMGSLVPTRG